MLHLFPLLDIRKWNRKVSLQLDYGTKDLLHQRARWWDMGRAGQMGVPLKQALRRTKDMIVVMREGL